MITDQTFQEAEESLQQIFTEAGWTEIPLPDENRIERIVERALHEQISKDTIDFVFFGFGAVLSSFSTTFLGENSIEEQDYRI